MKRIILALIAAMTLCSLVQAKNRTVTENDSLGNKKRVIELRDTTIDGKTVTDTHRLYGILLQLQKSKSQISPCRTSTFEWATTA